MIIYGQHKENNLVLPPCMTLVPANSLNPPLPQFYPSSSSHFTCKTFPDTPKVLLGFPDPTMNHRA